MNKAIIERCKKILQVVGPTDKQKAESALREYDEYPEWRNKKSNPPRIVWCQSVAEATKLARETTRPMVPDENNDDRFNDIRTTRFAQIVDVFRELFLSPIKWESHTSILAGSEPSQIPELQEKLYQRVFAVIYTTKTYFVVDNPVRVELNPKYLRAIFSDGTVYEYRCFWHDSLDRIKRDVAVAARNLPALLTRFSDTNMKTIKGACVGECVVEA